MNNDNSKPSKVLNLSSIINHISDSILSKFVVSVGGILAGAYIFLSSMINGFIDHRIERVVSNMMVEKINNESIQKLTDKEKLMLGVNNAVQTILKNKAGQVIVDKIILDSKNREASIEFLSSPGSTIWLMLQIEGLSDGDKILMIDADTGYKKKISKNGARNINITDFIKKGDEIAAKREEAGLDASEAKSDDKFFVNIRKLNFTFRSVGSDEIRTNINQPIKKDDNKKASVTSEITNVNLSYIMLTYPPLSVNNLNQAKSEDQLESTE